MQVHLENIELKKINKTSLAKAFRNVANTLKNLMQSLIKNFSQQSIEHSLSIHNVEGPNRGVNASSFLIHLINNKHKLKRKQKRKRKQGNLHEGREAPPRRCLHPLRFCFRFRFCLLKFVLFLTRLSSVGGRIRAHCIKR